MSLATKYRPISFEDVVGQLATIKVLKKEVASKNIKNCYLFCGDSGCGKTTVARIFANDINNGFCDPIEIDAASNNGVDNVRAIVETAKQRSLVGEYKIIIIDECHMITTAGWNAFLKYIEEPASKTVLIFCTTDPSKIPNTILNRLTRHNFSKISTDFIRARLEYICQQEGFINYQATCDLISKHCHGSMREAITSLEQCADYSTDLKLENTSLILNEFSYETMFKLTWALAEGNQGEIFTIIDKLDRNGKDLKQFVDKYSYFVMDLATYCIFKDITLTAIPAYLATADNGVVQYTVEGANKLNQFNELALELLNLRQIIKYDSSYDVTIKTILIKAMKIFKETN